MHRCSQVPTSQGRQEDDPNQLGQGWVSKLRQEGNEARGGNIGIITSEGNYVCV